MLDKQYLFDKSFAFSGCTCICGTRPYLLFYYLDLIMEHLGSDLSDRPGNICLFNIENSQLPQQILQAGANDLLILDSNKDIATKWKVCINIYCNCYGIRENMVWYRMLHRIWYIISIII